MFFLIFVLTIFIIFLGLITTKIRLKIVDLEFDSSNRKGGYLNEKFLIILKIYLFDKIPVFKIKINKAKIEKMKNSNSLNKIKDEFNQKLIKNENDFDKDLLFAIYKFPFGIYNSNLRLDIGTEEILITTFLIPIISTFISLILKKYAKNNYQRFEIKPIYQEKNVLKLEFRGIFEIKMIHIINTICILKKKKRRVKENVRTSNRRSYDYSYE